MDEVKKNRTSHKSLISISFFQERKLAVENDYPDPVNANFDATTEMYFRCAELVLERMREQNIRVIFATHNDKTLSFLHER